MPHLREDDSGRVWRLTPHLAFPYTRNVSQPAELKGVEMGGPAVCRGACICLANEKGPSWEIEPRIGRAFRVPG